MKFPRFLSSLLAVALSLLPTACKTTTEPKPAASATKLTLTVAINDIYCKETACECVHQIASRSYAKVLNRLREQYHIELKPVYIIEPYELEKELKAGKFDGVICKPWFAFHSVGKTRNFQRLADILDPNGRRYLSGIMVVAAKSSFRKPVDLDGKTIVIGQPDAYEKHQAALALLKQNGIKAGKIVTKASCMENLGELMDGNADAAVVSDYAFKADCAVDFAKAEDFRVLAETAPIPLTSVMLDTRKVSAADRLRVQQALLELVRQGIPDDFVGQGFVLPTPWETIDRK